MSSTSENVDDRLSMLPEDILSRILSLMPTKYAVGTSVLSKRWRYTWTSVTNLDFDYTRRSPNMITLKFVDGNEEKFTKFVDRVLKFCKTSHLNSFRLHISSSGVSQSSILNWIDNAVRLNVRELDVCVIQSELPLSLFTCKTLTDLRLEPSDCDLKRWEFPSTIYLPCLKTLDIFLCDNPLAIQGCCPVLESLSLNVSCYVEQDFILNIPTLKRLNLLCISIYDDDNRKIILRLPKLEYLFVDGELCSLFEMEDVSSLVEASISCSACSFDFMWADILNKLRGVQKLTIANFRFTSPLPIFPNMKQLELNGTWESGQITQFLESCPELKILCIDSVDVAERVFKKQKPEESKLIPACMLTNLTSIKISKCWGDTCDIEFLEYMLGNAQVLKSVTIFALENLLIEDDPWFCAQVLKFPRASPHCEIRFRSWKLPQSQESEYSDISEYSDKSEYSDSDEAEAL
ncbi:putative F-box domain, FBD domain, leucine-rich repeat domain superfamily [Helianthus annuus]|uniref:FBD-associated F-box protein At4g10400 n=1 Tax=Helianthus annuus TaxID=4232 RepID=UPI000B8FBCAD|nr:FBD-associated F-box protein At4g10400 [Helianthus annuus]KAJ0435441.1 putative F-box domain, FBD domain, leucine-rich repeat domain superfamily [Helianthus annuus]